MVLTGRALWLLLFFGPCLIDAGCFYDTHVDGPIYQTSGGQLPISSPITCYEACQGQGLAKVWE
jgi:hypothetical protein